MSRVPGGLVFVDVLRGAKRFILSVPFVFCVIGAFFAFGGGFSPAGAVAPLGSAHRAMTLYDPDTAWIRMIRAEEIRDTDSYRNSSGTLQHSNRHVLGLVFKFIGTTLVPTTTGGEGSMPTAGTTGSTTSSTTGLTTGSTGIDGFDGMVGMMEPPDEGTIAGTDGVTTGLTTAGTTAETTGDTTGGEEGGSHENYTLYYIWVASPGEIAKINGRTPVLVDSGRIIAGVPAGVGGEIRYNEEAYIQMASEGALSGGSITVTLESMTFVWHVYPPYTDPDNGYYTCDSSFQTVNYDVTKYACQDASVDTRKAFGTANRNGELLDDPNAQQAELNFGNWVYKGGVFVGNMPYQVGDQSGVARAQLYPQTSSRTTPCRLAALTMFYRDTPPDVTTAVTLGAYIPGASDPNLSSTASTVKWPTRWDIQPRTTPGSPRDDTKDPLFRLEFPSNTATNEYANWQLSSVTSTDSVTPVRAFQGVGIAIENEDDFVTTPGVCWRYFSSQEFESEFSTFPESDSAPRLWVVDYDSQTTFSQHWF